MKDLRRVPAANGDEGTAPLQACRVLFTSLPWLSHFLAQLPLARAMADAGHEVRFATSEVLGPTVRRAGFAVIPVPMQRKERTGKELTVPVGGAYGGFAYLEHAAWGAPALLEAFEQWCPDVVVRDPLELGSCLAAERAGIPHAVGREGPFWPVELRRSTLSGLDDLRRQLGLPADPMVEAPYRYLAFAFAPPGLLGASAYVPPVMHFVQPSQAVLDAGVHVDDWTPPPPGRQLVYATLGTVFNRDSELLETMAGALADQPYDALLTIGPDKDLEEFASTATAANVVLRRYVPQSMVLPRSDVLVAHGGFATIIGALQQGVPSVLMPIAGDQYRNAAWCASAGAAVVLDDFDRTPRLIQNAVNRVLSDPSYAAAAARLAREIAGLPDLAAAVALVVRVATERVAIPRSP